LASKGDARVVAVDHGDDEPVYRMRSLAMVWVPGQGSRRGILGYVNLQSFYALLRERAGHESDATRGRVFVKVCRACA
jgi:hypothetical protein